MKKSMLTFLFFATIQFASAQLSNPGRDDGPREIIPTQGKPQLNTPKVVLGATKCSCGSATNGGGWDGIGFFAGDAPLSKYSCGYQFNARTSDKIKFASGGYNCTGRETDVKCNGIVSATLFKDDIAIQNIPIFNFNTEIIKFSTTGNYKLVFSARCKTAKCDTCIYYFTVQ